MRRGGGKRDGVVCSDIRVPELNAPARASRCTFRKRHQGTLSGALRSEARRSGAPERVGSPAGAQEGVHRHAPVARLRESPHGYPKHMFGKRGRTRTVPQHGKAVSSERDIRVPEAKRGRVPCRNEDEYRFPRGIQAEPCIPHRTWNGTREHKRGAASHMGDDASFVRTGSAEKLSLPRRTQPESAHARGRRQPDRG